MNKVIQLSLGGVLVFAAGFWFAKWMDQPVAEVPAPPPVQAPQADTVAPTGTVAPNRSMELIRTLNNIGGNDLVLPFPQLIEATTGCKVYDLNPSYSVHADILFGVRKALDATLAAFNAPDSPTRGLSRINEASALFEERLRQLIDADPLLSCAFPTNAKGDVQRAGYPDLRIVHEASGVVAYLDPKLFETGHRETTLRTFYYSPGHDIEPGSTEPRTLKVRDSAIHLLAGIEHDGQDGQWKFLRWHLVDLSRLRVRLKSEFQASNKDLYNDFMIIATGPEK